MLHVTQLKIKYEFARSALAQLSGTQDIQRMNKKRAKLYISAWAEKRGLTLEQLSHRIELETGGRTLSKSQISRIGSGKSGYSHESLEAIAFALQLDSPGDLFRPPPSDETATIHDLVNRIPSPFKPQAVKILKAFIPDDDRAA